MRTLVATAILLATLGTALAADTRHGQTIYQVNCSGCHGPAAQGNIGPKLAGESANWSFAIFSRAMLKDVDDKGERFKVPMPYWGKTGFKGDQGRAPTPTEIRDLQAFLKAQKK